MVNHTWMENVNSQQPGDWTGTSQHSVRHSERKQCKCKTKM